MPADNETKHAYNTPAPPCEDCRLISQCRNYAMDCQAFREYMHDNKGRYTPTGVGKSLRPL